MRDAAIDIRIEELEANTQKIKWEKLKTLVGHLVSQIFLKA